MENTLKQQLSRNSFIVLTYSILILIVFSTSSCSDSIGGSSGGGREGEVVVVLNDEFQKGIAGEIVNHYLSDSYLLLPQHEPLFKLYTIAWSSFTPTFRSFRNIVKIDIDPKYTESDAKVQQNEYQTVINLLAPNSDEFVELFKKHGEQIVQALSESEKRFAFQHIKKGTDIKLQKYLRDKHMVDIILPKGYEIRKETNNFVWLSMETKDLSLGLVFYYYPYTDKSMFTSQYLISKRDSLLQKYIKGPLYPEKMSYMTTTTEPVAPIYKETTINKEYAVELRGLWNVTDDFMAGPFMSITRLDKERNRIVTVEGYVYYPSEKKRKYMRWFEAILENVAFPEIKKK